MKNTDFNTNQSVKPQPKRGIGLGVASIVLAAAMGFSGCTSMVADVTGASPVGVMPGDRTLAQRMRDSGIERNAKVNLYKLDSRFEKRSRVNVASFHDAVLITGQVPDPHLVKLATQSVKAIREVKVVHNELNVASQSSYGDIMQDSVTKADIRKNLLVLPNFKESRVKIAVERGTVYVMGMITEPEKKRVLETIQQSNNILKIVSLIDVIDANGNLIKTAKPKPKVLNQSVVMPVAVDSEIKPLARASEKATDQRPVKVVVHKPVTATGNGSQVAQKATQPITTGVKKQTANAVDKVKLQKPKVKVITRELSVETPALKKPPLKKTQ